MLQGNPFETQLTVDERTSAVQHGVSQQRTPFLAGHNDNLRWQWRSAMPKRSGKVGVLPQEYPHLDIQGLSANSLRITKASWLVPAGLAVGVLLISILGG